MAGQKHDKQYVLQQRLGATPEAQMKIKRGWDAAVGDDGSGSAGRIFAGLADQKWGRSSIIGMAKQNVFEFPVFVSDSVPLEYATAINTLLEQVYASYLQMALSIDPVVSSEELRRRGGQFSKFKTDITKYIECVDLTYQKDAAHNVVNTEYGFMEFSLAAIDNRDAGIILEALDYVPLSEFNHYFQEARVAGSNTQSTSSTSQTSSKSSSGSSRGETGEMSSSDSIENSESTQTGGGGGGRNGGGTSTSTTTKGTQSASRKYGQSEQSSSSSESGRQSSTTTSPTKRSELTNLSDDDIANLNDAIQVNQHQKLQQELQKIARENAASDAFLDRIEKGDRLAAAADAADEELRRLLEAEKKDPDAIEAAQKKCREAHDAYEDFVDNVRDPDDPRQSTAEFKLLFAKVKKANADYMKAELDIDKIKADMARDERKELREAEKHLHDTKIKASQMMDETKINKLNTMKPLMMVVNMSIMDKNGGVSRPIEYMVGVKTHCRLVKAETLPEVVKYPVKEMDEISRKAKWRAGELKFFKDIVFDIKGKKQTAIDSNDPNRKWYRRLFELSHKKGDSAVAHFISGKKSADGLIPNVTMVITKGDVDNIEDAVGIDMLKPSNAIGFCSQLFMMGIVVVDIDAQSIKLLFPDINNDYEVQSLAAVERQIAQLGTAGAKTRDIFDMLK